MMPRLLVFLALVLVLTSGTATAVGGFRGLPLSVGVESLNLVAGAAGESENRVEVCYCFGTTVPILDYFSLAGEFLKGLMVACKDIDGTAVNEDPQPAGIRFRMEVGSSEYFVYLNSDSRAYDVGQVQFFNSLIRSTAGASKPLQPISFSLSYADMVVPQYEWVRSCESIAFGKAYSESYVRSLFRGPGPIGYLTGSAQFVFNVVPPSFVSSHPLQASLRDAPYVVPVFGVSAFEEGDYEMIALSHYANS